ncbi:MAG: hypothetical protein COW03_10960 [Cytophagales bacterium CG12_big_fil_rev_8_21_14_0_65_40_12]|nr:MAG: hypothetical protein COW03_10960 [Cytophagales bacterium CG12_big_fil_rev_8_21_14_0_65_40_12]PIW05635.1 MAG: hypothetical protein COW40_04105 [Cytophagales bacterium CG17_big_fil_post_rev_8_21_14_2_50_40_13]
MSFQAILFILILSIPIYLVCKWCLRKLKLGNDKNRKLIAILPTIILSPIIYSAVITLWIFSISYYPSMDFDQKTWNSSIKERYKMSKDIIESKMLIGKTKEEVVMVLGNKYASDNKESLSYELGFIPGLMNIDPSFLYIEFENGIVKNVYQYNG